MKLKTEVKTLVDKINQNPLLRIFDYNESPGISRDRFDSFKVRFGLDLPDLLKDLYLEMNGFNLVYGLKENSDKAVKTFNALSKDYLVEKGPPYVLGSIKFLPFENVFLEDNWNGIFYDTGSKTDQKKLKFINKEYTYNELGKLLKPFDLYSEEICASFLLLPDSSFDVILLMDNYADWQNSRIISFEDYCKLIIDTVGIIEARERYMSETGGDSMKKLKLPESKKLTPKIFK